MANCYSSQTYPPYEYGPVGSVYADSWNPYPMSHGSMQDGTPPPLQNTSNGSGAGIDYASAYQYQASPYGIDGGKLVQYRAKRNASM